MTKHTEVMKLALEALEDLQRQYAIYPNSFWDWSRGRKAITALREALASEAKEQPAQQEPVAWCSQCGHKCPQPAPIQQEPIGWWDDKLGFFAEKHFDQLQPIYKSPPQRAWVGLTEFDIDQIPYSCSHADSRLIAYAIEAKLKEKNGITKEQT